MLLLWVPQQTDSDLQSIGEGHYTIWVLIGDAHSCTVPDYSNFDVYSCHLSRLACTSAWNGYPLCFTFEFLGSSSCHASKIRHALSQILASYAFSLMAYPWDPSCINDARISMLDKPGWMNNNFVRVSYISIYWAHVATGIPPHWLE